MKNSHFNRTLQYGYSFWVKDVRKMQKWKYSDELFLKAQRSYLGCLLTDFVKKVPVFPATIVTYAPSSQDALWNALCGVVMSVHSTPTVARVTLICCYITGVAPSILLQFLFDESLVVARYFRNGLFHRLFLHYYYPAGILERNKHKRTIFHL